MKTIGNIFLLAVIGCLVGYLTLGVLTYKQPTFLTTTILDGALPNYPAMTTIKPGAYMGYRPPVVKAGGIVLVHPTMS